MPFQLPELPYAKDALAPIMSPETLEYHHGKHHKAYVTKTNELIANDRQLSDASLIEVVTEAKVCREQQAVQQQCPAVEPQLLLAMPRAIAGSKAERQLAKLIQDGFGRRRRFSRSCRKKRSITSPAAGHGWCSTAIAEDHIAPRCRHANRPRGDAAAVHARCVGTCLLHRLSKRASAFRSVGIVDHRQLGFRRTEPRRRRLRARQSGGL